MGEAALLLRMVNSSSVKASVVESRGSDCMNWGRGMLLLLLLLLLSPNILMSPSLSFLITIHDVCSSFTDQEPAAQPPGKTNMQTGREQ